jgi:hypothetical protein
MIELILSVCLISAPGSCKDVHLTYTEEYLTPHQCVMRGQPEMARWIAEHPQWRIARWTCSRAGRAAKDI